MKPYKFGEQEYTDLNSLGKEFSIQFAEALQAIKGKEFLKFVNKFKNYKKRIKEILYQSRYLQNALSIIIYLITEEHILIVGNRKYDTIESCLNDLQQNDAFAFFAEDHGFTYTLLPTLQDERLKADLQAYEACARDEVAIKHLSMYFQKDSIEPLPDSIKEIFTAKDGFLAAKNAFESFDIQLSLASKYGLGNVLELRSKSCCVFTGLQLIKDEVENPLTILENSFYTSWLKEYKQHKYKKEGKAYKKKVKSFAKTAKKYDKLSMSEKINYHENLYHLYVEAIDYGCLNKIIYKTERDKPTIPYAGTFVSLKICEEYSLTAEEALSEYQPILKCEYNLNKFYKSLKTHKNFSIWTFVIMLFTCIYYLCFIFLDGVRDSILSLLYEWANKLSPQQIEYPQLLHILFFIGAGVSVLMAIVILILRAVASKKYNKLCRLAYYRKNEKILTEKEQKEYETIQPFEIKYAKSIDRYYRFYGGVVMAACALAVTILTVGVLYYFGYLFMEDLATHAADILTAKNYFLFIPAGMFLLLGFARHKKTSWSILLTRFISFALSIGMCFLVQML